MNHMNEKEFKSDSDFISEISNEDIVEVSDNDTETIKKILTDFVTTTRNYVKLAREDRQVPFITEKSVVVGHHTLLMNVRVACLNENSDLFDDDVTNKIAQSYLKMHDIPLYPTHITDSIQLGYGFDFTLEDEGGLLERNTTTHFLSVNKFFNDFLN